MIGDRSRELAEWLFARFAVRVPEGAPAPNAPSIVRGGYFAGDAYTGGIADDELALVGFRRPQGGALALRFRCAVHQESGDVDAWALHVRGARGDEESDLRRLFAPTERERARFNDRTSPTFTFEPFVCALCAPIPEVARANTGRDERFGEPIVRLRRLGIGSDEDLRECPECDAMFTWYDDRAFTGSGNNDEEVLRRVTEARAGVVHALLRRGEASPGSLARRVATAFLALPEMERSLTTDWLFAHDLPLLHALVLPCLEVLVHHDNEPASKLVARVASTAEHAAFVRAELALRPKSPALDRLRALFA